MKAFQKLENAICAPLPVNEVDTDVIYPGRFLNTIKRTGLGPILFYDLRNPKGNPDSMPFVLDQKAYEKAQVMVVGDHFGCGSSREHAPWALLDFGIRCLISTRFGDIFLGNCTKNGILCISLPQEKVDLLMAHAQKNKTISVDLEKELIQLDGEGELSFSIDPYIKTTLLLGLDEIAQTLQKEDKINAFEQKHFGAFPWLRPQISELKIKGVHAQ